MQMAVQTAEPMIAIDDTFDQTPLNLWLNTSKKKYLIQYNTIKEKTKSEALNHTSYSANLH